MLEIPASQHCVKILEKREHACIGISPFNSYFSEEVISKLINWGNTQFKDFHLFVPDILPYFNFLALGYSHEKAQIKCKRQWTYLRNKIRRAFTKCALSNADEKIITASAIKDNPEYQKIYNKLLQYYQDDQDFKIYCLKATSEMLKKYSSQITTEMLNTSVKYILSEMPFYLDTPRILCKTSSIFVYHESIEIFIDLYKNRRHELVANNQGHVILKLDKGFYYE
jgi:cyclo(L-tyrosyl-L-tyrosyl) synthase